MKTLLKKRGLYAILVLLTSLLIKDIIMKKGCKAEIEKLSLDEEMLMFTSYRYCIGRKSYVNTLAPYIGKKYYPLLCRERKEFTANDIRKCIGDCLRFNSPSFGYAGSVAEAFRNPLGDYLTWINSNIEHQNDFRGIKGIVCYKENYNVDSPKLFDVERCERRTLEVFESDISDFFIWEELASLFDVGNHKWVTVNVGGKEEVIECFEVWQNVIEPTENEGYYRNVRWRYEKVLKSVARYLERGDLSGHLDKSCIVKIEDYAER